MSQFDFLKRTWAVIDLDALCGNYNMLAARVAPAKIMSVVKANGYGHGDFMVANALQEQGADFFAVSNLDEALMLRRANISGGILILGFTPVQAAEMLSENRITQTLLSLEYARELNAECEKSGITVDVHIKLDTGMGRIGFAASESGTVDEIAELFTLKNLKIEGIFSHFSSADSADSASVEYTEMQIERFRSALTELEARGLHFAMKHLQNSAGIAFYNDLHMDYARAGIVLYGLAPSDEPVPFELKPVMSLKSVVSMVKPIKAGSSISYGRTFCADRPMVIATIPIGYADGYPRSLSNKADMLIHGKRARIVGNICMDQLMLDVTDIPNVKSGDSVTVVGRDGDECIGFDELAHITGSISYELMCLIGKRVAHVYVKNGATVEVLDYNRQLPTL